MPRIALGCGNFGGIGSAPEFFGGGLDEPQAFAVMDAAWELGHHATSTPPTPTAAAAARR